MTDLKNWDRRPNGDVRLAPLLGWDIAKLPMTGLVRLLYADNPGQLETGGLAVQLAMTAVQVRELAQALSRMADLLDEDNRPHGTGH